MNRTRMTTTDHRTAEVRRDTKETQIRVRVDLDGTNARKGDQWDMGARIREVEQGPDGAVYVLEDGGRGSEGRLLKLTPRG